MREAPRETVAARLKAMLRLPGVTVLDAERVEVRGSEEELADALRRAEAAGAILRRSIGHVQGRSLVLWVLPVEEPAPEPIAIRVLCAWCPAVITEAPAGAPESHGICEDCTRRYFPDYAEDVLNATKPTT